MSNIPQPSCEDSPSGTHGERDNHRASDASVSNFSIADPGLSGRVLRPGRTSCRRRRRGFTASVGRGLNGAPPPPGDRSHSHLLPHSAWVKVGVLSVMAAVRAPRAHYAKHTAAQHDLLILIYYVRLTPPCSSSRCAAAHFSFGLLADNLCVSVLCARATVFDLNPPLTHTSPLIHQMNRLGVV